VLTLRSASVMIQKKDFGSALKGVSRDEPKPVNETEFVFAVVVLVHFSPVSCDVSGDDVTGSMIRLD
jgi:hypothetical protein